MREICQDALPVTPWMNEKTSRLPGLQPLNAGDWLRIDEVYAQQMAYRTELIATKRDDVHRLSDSARPAAEEVLDHVLGALAGLNGFEVRAQSVVCPDGRKIKIERENPLITCGHLIQEDLNIMQQVDGRHVLTASLLCFPASWSLQEKFKGDLSSIHRSVPKYDDNISKRVQRVFDGIQVGRPMWRANFLIYSNPDLFQPRREDNRRSIDPNGPLWVRVERQCLLRLPETGAVVFSIHSYVVPMNILSGPEKSALLDG